MVMPINRLTGGKKLPVLSNPATAAQILAGYEAINGAGELMTGTKISGDYAYKAGSATVRQGRSSSVNLGVTPYCIIVTAKDGGGDAVPGGSVYFGGSWLMQMISSSLNSCSVSGTTLTMNNYNLGTATYYYKVFYKV